MVCTCNHILAVTDGAVQDWTKGRQHRIKQVYRVIKNGQPLVRAIEDRDTVVTPVKPTQPRTGTVKQQIHDCANVMWKEAGSPMDIAVLRTLRKRIMDTLEEEGVKRTSASTELGQWQKLIVA